MYAPPTLPPVVSTLLGIPLDVDVAGSGRSASGAGSAVVRSSLIHISSPARLARISYCVLCLKKITETPRPY